MDLKAMPSIQLVQSSLHKHYLSVYALTLIYKSIYFFLLIWINILRNDIIITVLSVGILKLKEAIIYLR